MTRKASKTQWTGPHADSATESRLASLATNQGRITSLTRELDPNQQQVTVVLDDVLSPPDFTLGPHLVVLDVDSTLIDQEVIDLLADHVGVGQEVAQITERAMQGDIDFEQALRKRVALLAGAPAAVIESVSAAVTLRLGARELIDTLQSRNCQVGLVSGGFVQVIAPLATSLGINLVAANELEVFDDKLSGNLAGPIIDRSGKAHALKRFAHESRVLRENTVAIGDGANDIDMLQFASYGIAFNAKAALQEVADVVVTSPYLSDCLYVLGLPARAT